MSEVLTQNEIDQLLAAINAGHDTEPEEFRPACDMRKVKIYDFKRPDKFTKEQIRTISMMHELFARELTGQFSALLKNNCHIHIASVDQLTYEEFIRSIPTPTTIFPIDMNPLGKAVAEIDPAITFAIINRMFGGENDELTKAQHELTEIEKISIKIPIDIMLKVMQNIWKNDFVPVEFILNSIDTTPQFIQITHPTEMGTLVTCEIKVDEVEGMINIFYPYLTFETILDKLNAQNWYKRYYNNKETFKKPILQSVELYLKALLFRKEISIGELKNISIGDEIKFKNNINLLIVDETRVLFSFEFSIKENEIYKQIKLLEKLNIMEKSYMNEKHTADKISVSLDDVNVQLSVELGRRKMFVKDILQLGEGSIIELDTLAGEPASIFANNVKIALGEIVVIDENYGIRVTDILDKE